MFGDDDDFEIDEEFLDGVFDAEKSAIESNVALDTTQNVQESSNDCDIEPSPIKRSRLSSCSNLSFSPPERNPPALRTSAETARLVAAAVSKHLPPQGHCRSEISTWSKNASPCRSPDLDKGCRSSEFENSLQDASSYLNNFLSPMRNAESHRQNNANADVSFHLNTSRVRQRKFPGPAGLLPDRAQRSNFSALMNLSGSDLDEPEEPLCSQSSASVLEDGPWSSLLSDLANEGQVLLKRYTVSWVKRKAAAKQLVGQKVPFLAAVLHSIDCSSPDPCVVLRDATGEIPGTLHRSVWDSFGGQLIAGSALVLRLVGVLSTGISARRHYLNITSNNIVTIYSSPLCDSSLPNTPSRSVRKTDVQKWTLNQLFQTVNSWEDQSRRKKEISVQAPPVQGTSSAFAHGMPMPGRPSVLEDDRNSFALPRAPNPSAFNPSERSTFVKPSASYSNNGTNNKPHLPNSSANASGRSLSSLGPQVPAPNRSSGQGGSNSFLDHPISQNFDPLRKHNTTSVNCSNSQQAGPSRFVPKKSTFAPVASRSELCQQPISSSSRASGQENAGAANSQSSRDLFSDADDLDISSVLDGIDSESLFSDF